MIQDSMKINQQVQKYNSILHRLPMKLLMILLLISFSFGTQGCETYYDFGHSPCAFRVQYNTNACVNFNFGVCQWEECVDWYYDGEDYYCWEYRTFTDNSYNSCTQRCCDDTVVYEQNAKAIEQCQEYLDWGFKRGLIIGLSVTFGFIFLVTCICCCCCCNRCQKFRQCLGDFCVNCCDCIRQILTCQCFRSSQQEQHPEGSIQNRSELEMVKAEEQFSPKWQYQGTYNQNLQNICSVCLEGSPSLQLQCGHVYHRKCIIACLKRKKQCIMCRSTHFNVVHIYCQQCLSAYFQTTLLEHMGSLDNVKQICEACKEVNMGELKMINDKM